MRDELRRDCQQLYRDVCADLKGTGDSRGFADTPYDVCELECHKDSATFKDLYEYVLLSELNAATQEYANNIRLSRNAAYASLYCAVLEHSIASQNSAKNFLSSLPLREAT